MKISKFCRQLVNKKDFQDLVREYNLLTAPTYIIYSLSYILFNYIRLASGKEVKCIYFRILYVLYEILSQK